MSTPRFSRLLQILSKLASWTFSKLWLRAKCRDRDHVPDTGPVLIVANHASYLDPVVLGTCTRRWVRFVARKSLARFRLFGWWMRHMGVILVDREAPTKQVLRDMVAALETGSCLGLFPEGTRTRDGSIRPFRGGVEFLVRKTGATVVPLGIDGTRRSFPRGARFPRPASVMLRYGPPWTPAEVLAEGGLERLRDEVERLAGHPGAPETDKTRPQVGRNP